jgi:hypothetical protein
MQKLITEICLSEAGLKSFEAQVNEYLKKGWKVCNLGIDKDGLRIICYCLLIDKSV